MAENTTRDYPGSFRCTKTGQRPRGKNGIVNTQQDKEEKESWGEHSVRCAVLSLLKHHSQSTLAKLSPLSQSTISTIANGRFKNRLSLEKCREFGEWYATFVQDSDVCFYYQHTPTTVPPDSRLTFHPDHEIPLLRSWYHSCPNPSPDKYFMFAYELNKGHVRQDRPKVTAEKVKIWWKNERQRERRLRASAAEVGTMTTGLTEGDEEGPGHHDLDETVAAAVAVAVAAPAPPGVKSRKRAKSSHHASRSSTQLLLMPRLTPTPGLLGGDGGDVGGGGESGVQCQGHDEGGGLGGEALPFGATSASPSPHHHQHQHQHHARPQPWGRQPQTHPHPHLHLHPHPGPRSPSVKQARKPTTASASTSTSAAADFSPAPSPSQGQGLSLMTPAGGQACASAWPSNFLSWNRRAQDEGRADVNFVPVPVPGSLIGPWPHPLYPVQMHQRMGGECGGTRLGEGAGERGEVAGVSDHEEYRGQTDRYKYSQDAAFSHSSASMDFSNIL